MSNVKHILFLSHYFPPEVNVPASRTFDHAKRWVREGIKVSVLTNNPNHPHGKLYPGYKNKMFSKEVIENIDIYRVKTFLTINSGFVLRLINYLVYAIFAVFTSFRIKKVDVVLATSPQFFCGLAGVVISKMKNTPFILEVRDLWPGQIEALGLIKNKVILSLLHKLEHFMYFQAKKIITATSFQNKYITDIGYPSSDITTVYNAVDLELFNESSHMNSKPLKSNNYFIASYIGFFGMLYSLDTIVDVAIDLKKIPDIQFKLYGDGTQKMNIGFRIVKNELTNVLLGPLLPKHKLPTIIQESDVGLIILKKALLFEQAIPTKMFEYWALKKPVILASPAGEGTEIMNRFKGGIVISPENVHELRDALLTLKHDSNLCKELGNNGYRAVKEFFNRDMTSEIMLNVILSISI